MERAKRLFSSLSDEAVATLERLASRMRERKAAMQALVERVDAAGHCAACGGACCAAGRYHFRISDALVYLVSGETFFTPLFDNDVCPYLAGDRCFMAPAYRPFNCITFNCESIEDLLPEEDRALFYRFEAEVRGIYAEIERLLPARSLFGALLDFSGCERGIDT